MLGKWALLSNVEHYAFARINPLYFVAADVGNLSFISLIFKYMKTFYLFHNFKWQFKAYNFRRILLPTKLLIQFNVLTTCEITKRFAEN